MRHGCRDIAALQGQINKLQAPSRLGLGERIILVKYDQISSTQKEAARKDEKGEPICPYQGLQPFEKEQEVFFFGRNKQVKEIFRKLNKKPFVAVIGASGSGKSSVVRAGLIPRLNKDSDLIPRLKEDSEWQSIDSIKPGSTPFANLVNNFNNVFNYSEELQEVNRLTKNIAEGLVSIIKSLRDSVNYLLLIDRQNHQLTLAQYQALGGVTGALNCHADKISSYKDFEKESPEKERLDKEKKWIKQIFLRLVQIDERGKDTRQRQPKVRLLDMAGNNPENLEALNQVLEDLVRGRLLVTGEGGQSMWQLVRKDAIANSKPNLDKSASCEKQQNKELD